MLCFMSFATDDMEHGSSCEDLAPARPIQMKPSCAFFKWPVGLMDKASASGAGDSRFESWAGHLASSRPSLSAHMITTRALLKETYTHNTDRGFNS